MVPSALGHIVRRSATDVPWRRCSSPHCQRTKGVKVGRLDHFEDDEQAWKEVLGEDGRAGLAETDIGCPFNVY
jgi:hypothetical protein